MSPRPLRLAPGVDLRRELERLCAQARTSAFVLAGIGSLGDAHLRLAGADTPTVVPGPVEVLTLSGSLSPDGAHLHMSVADAHGRVVGGHVGYGNLVRTTAELLLADLPGWALSREVDDATGYPELTTRRTTPGRDDDLS